MNFSCVYAIEQRSTGRRYIGSSRNVRHRINRHFTDLRCDRHHCIFLQRAFNKYGEIDFDWTILMVMPDGMSVVAEEQYWLDALREGGDLFNTCWVAGTCEGIKQSPETIAKRTAKLIGRKMTPEQCRRISEAKKKAGISEAGKASIRAACAAKRFKIPRDEAQAYVDRYRAGEDWKDIFANSGRNIRTMREATRAALGVDRIKQRGVDRAAAWRASYPDYDFKTPLK